MEEVGQEVTHLNAWCGRFEGAWWRRSDRR